MVRLRQKMKRVSEMGFFFLVICQIQSIYKHYLFLCVAVGGGAAAGSSRNLWVSGLSSTTRATDLKTLFSKYGKVSLHTLSLPLSLGIT